MPPRLTSGWPEIGAIPTLQAIILNYQHSTMLAWRNNESMATRFHEPIDQAFDPPGCHVCLFEILIFCINHFERPFRFHLPRWVPFVDNCTKQGRPGYGARCDTVEHALCAILDIHVRRERASMRVTRRRRCDTERVCPEAGPAAVRRVPRETCGQLTYTALVFRRGSTCSSQCLSG